MATRMQQRRGTAAQWTSADPILAAGEIGFESDTGQFKIGDGVNHWDDISYFKNLEDLGGSLDDYVLITSKAQANGVASLDSSGKIPVAQLGNLINGAPDALNTLKELADAIANDGTFASTMVSALSGKLALGGGTMTGSINMSGNTISNVLVSAPTIDSNPATKGYVDSGISTHTSDTTDVHGIADTSALATTAATTSAISTSVSNHNALTANVHGIADTSALALTATVNSGLALKANLASPTFTGTVAGITKSMVGLGNVDNTADSAKPVSTATQTALDAKAPLASPALTGVPTAPTAATGTSTTQVATTAFVGTAVSNLVASAPAALDTLNELATALGNDASFSTTITNAIALKAPLASPTFTGTNTVEALTVSGSGLITASSAGLAFTDGTQTKEGVASRTPIVQKSASYTLSALTERDSLIEVSSATGVTITIPTNTAVAYPIGTSIDILQTGAGQVTIAPVDGTVTVNATPGLKLRTTWSSCTLFKRAANTWVVYGDLMA
jgi:hypothetical protein